MPGQVNIIDEEELKNGNENKHGKDRNANCIKKKRCTVLEIKLSGEVLKQSDQLVYLRCVISSDGSFKSGIS